MRAHRILAATVLILGLLPAQVSYASLLDQMRDLERLAVLPNPWSRTVQFSSYDRRSRNPEEPDWYANSDGFGREPIPGFAEVLRPADSKGVGHFVVADVRGPGVIVRTWSAGMAGRLRVFLDDAEAAVFDGKADVFMRRKSQHFLDVAGLKVDPGDTFAQVDADYLPIPFAKRLRITWKGNIRQLHFYQVQVRLYGADVAVAPFDPARTLKECLEDLMRLVARQPLEVSQSAQASFRQEIVGGATWEHALATSGPGAIREFRIEARAADRERALRGILLRIHFDGAARPQVEAPLGDFFGAAPGIAPFQGLPMTVEPPGTMICRFVMPYRLGARMTLRNTTGEPVVIVGEVICAPWTWNERSLHFRAKWRVDHELDRAPPRDLPFIMVRGAGRLVGATSILMNPSPAPFQGGNWWGEGDEKIFVDDETTPSTFGTGSEDYYNYSWSRPDLFSHPYCGQPICTGPGCAGYVTNFRWQIMDAIPFHESLAFYMEYYHHIPPPDLSYARIAYHYARPGAIDDHRAVSAGELVVPPLPKWKPEPLGAARGALIVPVRGLKPMPSEEASKPELESPFRYASQGHVVGWKAAAGDTLRLTLEVPDAGNWEINLVAVHCPAGARVKVKVGGAELKLRNGDTAISLASEHLSSVQNVRFKAVALEKGSNSLVIDALEPGFVGLDYFWVKPGKR